MISKNKILSLWIIISVCLLSYHDLHSQIRAFRLPSANLGYDGKNLSYVMGAGDFNGDGVYDFITRVWVDEVTEGQADKSFETITYAYLNDGTFLWEFRHRMSGNDIDGDPNWVVTLTVWDMDGDGKDDVVSQMKEDGTIKLIIIDGLTGQVKKKANINNPRPRRNMQATLAYLNGWDKDPYVVLFYGDNHHRGRAIAYDKNLQEFWRFDGNAYAPLQYWNKPYSWTNIYTSDFDDDQKDEIICGPILIDHDGSVYLDGTQFDRQHVGAAERSYIADIDPTNPGYEWFLLRVGKDPGDALRVQPNYWKGPYLIDVDQKRVIWHHNERTSGLGWGRLHHGWVGEIDTNVPGLEVWAKGYYYEGDEWRDILNGVYGTPPVPEGVRIPGYSEKWILYSATGKILSKAPGYPVGNPVYWDDDRNAEYYIYRLGKLYDRFQGHVIKGDFAKSFGNGESSQADIWGDWREEILTSSEYTFYVYSNTSPTSFPDRPSPRTNHNYLMNLASIATGLPKVIMHGEPNFNLGCDNDNICEPGEDQFNCPNDCGPPAISKLVLLTAPQMVFTDNSSGIITVQSQTVNGIPVNVTNATSISLNSTSITGQFSLLQNPFVPVTSLNIPAGSSTVSFYYRDSAVGTPTITCSEVPDQGWKDAVQQVTIKVLPPPPIIVGFDPIEGSVGTEVAITGQNLSDVTQVTFNGVEAATVNVVSDTELKVEVPTGASSGKIKVVTPGGEATSTADFTVTIPPTPDYVQRVNAGGNFYTGTDGREWAADQAYTNGSWGFVGGRTFSRNDAIANTTDDILYQSERYRPTYRFTVAAGKYNVQLLFAEIFYNAGGIRRFDVFLEGTKVISNFDIFNQVGHDFAMVKNYEVDVTDGILDITFGKISDSPKISAIEVSSSGPPLPPPPPPTISKLVFLSPPRTVFANSSSEIMTIQTQSATGTPVNVAATTSISLTSTSGTGQFSISQDPFVPVNLVDIVAGSNTASFYYRDGAVGTPTITCSETPDQSWTDAVQQVTVNALPLPPVIVGFDPIEGQVGNEVTITGQNLSGATQVTFNGVAANTVIEVSNAELKVNVPAGASTGKIKVITPGGEVTSVADFTVTIPPTPDYVQRVNAGGAEYTGTDGRVWSADQAYTNGSWGFVGGRTFYRIHPIANTEDDVLFQSERYHPTYRFTVAPGKYIVQLLFAEIFYNAAGIREFEVVLEGNKVISNFDIFSLVGHDVAMVKEYEVDVTDGILDITFIKISDSPKISAIEVKSAGGGLAPKIANQELLANTGYLPNKFQLSQNYPNPFNPETRIGISLPNEGKLTAIVFDLNGREIKRIFENVMSAGKHELFWDGRNNLGLTVSSGIYLLRVVFETDVVRLHETRRMVLLK